MFCEEIPIYFNWVILWMVWKILEHVLFYNNARNIYVISLNEAIELVDSLGFDYFE